MARKKADVKAKKINVTLPEEFLLRMDTYATDKGLTRSGLIYVAVKQYLDAQELMPDVTEALRAFSKLADVAANMSMSKEEIMKEADNLQSRADGLESRMLEAGLPVIEP